METRIQGNILDKNSLQIKIGNNLMAPQQIKDWWYDYRMQSTYCETRVVKCWSPNIVNDKIKKLHHISAFQEIEDNRLKWSISIYIHQLINYKLKHKDVSDHELQTKSKQFLIDNVKLCIPPLRTCYTNYSCYR